jgi:hypothetical protein
MFSSTSCAKFLMNLFAVSKKKYAQQGLAIQKGSAVQLVACLPFVQV